MRTYTQEEKQAVIDRVIMYRKVKGDIMTTSKIPTATTIPLEPIENEHFLPWLSRNKTHDGKAMCCGYLELDAV